MADAIRWLRISYWVGAVTDCVAAVQMLYPPLFKFGMGLSAFTPGSDYRYAMGMGASLMLDGLGFCSGRIKNRWSAEACCR